MKQPVSTIMTVDLITTGVTDKLEDVANVFENIKIRHVPVMAGNTLVGIISKSDVIRMKQFCQVLESGDRGLLKELQAVSIKSLMKAPKTINANQTVEEAAEIFSREHLSSLPVLNDDQRLVGIVTTTDVIKYALKDARN